LPFFIPLRRRPIPITMSETQGLTYNELFLPR
jgi:hypothetical protein